MDIPHRFQSYWKEYKYEKTDNLRPIINAMRKYGLDKFFWEILEDGIESQECLNEREKHYICLYHSLINENGYNIELGGNSTGKHSMETRYKIGAAQKGSKNHMYGRKGKDNPLSVRVIELTTGNMYDSATIAAQSLNVQRPHISAVCKGTRSSVNGYVFRYLDSNNQIVQYPSMMPIRFDDVRGRILPQYRKYI